MVVCFVSKDPSHFESPNWTDSPSQPWSKKTDPFYHPVQNNCFEGNIIGLSFAFQAEPNSQYDKWDRGDGFDGRATVYCDAFRFKWLSSR